MSSVNKKVITGNEAISRGFYEAGGVVAASYPGSPTVEILEKLKSYDEIYSEFSTNEKVATEVAIGASIYGVRSMATMKHVGVNIAADPLMTFTQTPTNGGFLLVTGDDPGLSSSQNEQDNRVWAKFASMAVLDPSDSQEAKDFTKFGLDISEKFQGPTMLRITSRLCHSRGIVEFNDRVENNTKEFDRNKDKYCMIPPASRDAQFFIKDRIRQIEEYVYDLEINRLEQKENSDTLIITSGLMYNHVKEINPDASIWKLGMVYPLSQKKTKEITSKYDKVLVIEEMAPFIENEIKLMGIQCEGKKYFSFTGELDICDVEKGLYEAGVLKDKKEYEESSQKTVARPPLFCSGCPHRPVFDILKKSKTKIVVGDIGCYSMASLFPFEQSNSIISMGASIGMAKGMRKAMTMTTKEEPIVAVIGDGTFFHSGIPSFVNLLHQKKDNENITYIVLDNRTTAMTGGQHNGGSGNFNEKDDMQVNIKSLLKSIGFNRVKEIDQYSYDSAKKLIDEEIAYEGLSVIVANGPCALKYKLNKPHFYVDPEICIGCRTCIKTNCPPLRMKKYEGIEKLKSSIDKDMCVGCSICAQVCPVNAIKSSADLSKEGENIDN